MIFIPIFFLLFMNCLLTFSFNIITRRETPFEIYLNNNIQVPHFGPVHVVPEMQARLLIGR